MTTVSRVGYSQALRPGLCTSGPSGLKSLLLTVTSERTSGRPQNDFAVGLRRRGPGWNRELARKRHTAETKLEIRSSKSETISNVPI